jgi:HEPN domain-containing protein
MQGITREWIDKAEADFTTAEREPRAAPPNFDAAAFLAQQSAEKYLKALLIEKGVKFPKTHDLATLLDLVVPLDPSWDQMRPALNALTSLGVEVRYPGTTADSEDAAEAIRTASAVRQLVRAALGMNS